MKYINGQLVRHPTLGLGKVIQIAGDRVTVFFKDAPKDPLKTIVVTAVPLEIPDKQSDEWLDNLDLNASDSKAVKRYISQAAAIEKFLHFFPQGFHDPSYFERERNYKIAAHELWVKTLNKEDFERLIQAGNFGEAADRAMRVEARVNLLSANFERLPLKDALKDAGAVKSFATGLYDLIYGADDFQHRFGRFSEVLGSLPQPKSKTHTWPNQTIFPFLALPSEHLFLKPAVTNEAAERRAFSLNYDSKPNWLTYSCLLRFGQILRDDLASLKPRDMIDIQSFIWATGDDSYSK